MKLENILYKKFSYTKFRKGQKEIIESVLNERDTLALLPTGTGKSLCYQLPGYLMDGSVIIISPLLSLMQDQVEQMKVRGEKRVVAINSFLSNEEREYVLNNINYYKFIYVSPEMLQNKYILHLLKSMKVSLFVVDEAHCISQWGYDFRPDYLELGRIRDELGNPATLALTATARKDVQEDIKKYLHMKDVAEYIYSMDRSNIALQVVKVENYEEKKQRLFDFVQKLKGPGILYFSSKKLADELANELNERGLGPAAAYHAGVEQDKRILLQQQFLYDNLSVMCATSAFGMGVNKENIRYVIHFHPPINLESYLQEIGRAGRDGNNSIAIMLYANDDIFIQKQLINMEYPTNMQIDYFLKEFGEMRNVIDKRNIKLDIPEGFTDVQWRILWKFNQQSENNHEFKEKLQNFIDERIAMKNYKLQEMTNWILYDGCRRDKLLSYFEERKSGKIDNCCDYCGVNFNEYVLKKETSKKRELVDWKMRLADIFNI